MTRTPHLRKIIEVIVSPQGDTKIETQGFVGGECRQASRFLEAALGLHASEQLTAEFYHQQSAAQSIQEGQA